MSGILINDNSTAVEAYNNLDATSDALSSAVNKLSSGLQIQTAADDPAGYLVGQYLQEESNGYGQSISNAQDAVSVLQTAQGALNQEASVLQTMNTLATEAANGGVQDASTSAAAQSEFASLQAELDQIATSTTYGTTPLLGGTYSGETFQVGPYDSANDQVVVTIAAATSTALAVNTTAVSIGTVAPAEAAMTAVQTPLSTGVSIGTVAAAEAAMTAVQTAISTVASQAAGVGATQNQIQALASNLTTAQQNIESAHANRVAVNGAQE